MFSIGILNKILIPDIEESVAKNTAEVKCYGVKVEDDLSAEIAYHDAIILFSHLHITSKTIERLMNCKAIVCASVGYDNVDVNVAKDKGIPVFNIPDYGTNDVADHAIALLLSYVRRIVAFSNALSKNYVTNWSSQIAGEYHRLAGKKLGIIGLGRIGTAFALRAKAFGLSVDFYDPYKQDGYDKALGVNRSYSLCQIIQECDVLSIHAPLTPETQGMITLELLKQAQKRPIVINTARGKIVYNDVIYQAIRNNYIEAYLADVMENEPPNENERLLEEYCAAHHGERLLITPHSAAYAIESQNEMREKAVNTALRAIMGIKCNNCVNGL